MNIFVITLFVLVIILLLYTSPDLNKFKTIVKKNTTDTLNKYILNNEDNYSISNRVMIEQVDDYDNQLYLNRYLGISYEDPKYKFNRIFIPDHSLLVGSEEDSKFGSDKIDKY